MKKIALAVLQVVIGIIVVVGLFADGRVLQAQEHGIDLPPMSRTQQGNHKLDSRLNQLSAMASSPGDMLTFAQRAGIHIYDDEVRVIVETVPGQSEAAAKAASNAGSIEASYGNLLQVLVPPAKLSTLADSSAISLVRMPLDPIPSVVSEGTTLVGSNAWQNAGVTGIGVKIAVVDGGFAGWSTRVTDGELPANVITHWAGSLGGPGTSNHGTACAEIIYDVAPGAQLYLVNYNSEVELGNAVQWLIAQGVSVISYSMGYPVGGPGDGTGPICQIVDQARNGGVLWVNSSGNSAQSHWQGNFADSDADGWLNFPSGYETNPIYAAAGQAIRVYLKWDDPWECLVKRL